MVTGPAPSENDDIREKADHGAGEGWEPGAFPRDLDEARREGRTNGSNREGVGGQKWNRVHAALE